MAIQNIKDLVDAENSGNTRLSSWRKLPSQTTGAGIWFDLSMSPGNPTPNYYAASPAISIALAQSTDGGIYHPPHPPNKSVYLKKLMAMSVLATSVPLPMIMCDYLMYYPFLDMSVTGQQDLITSIPLPRYSTGLGVQMMAVEVAAQSGVGNPQFYVQYTNSDGVSGRITPLVSCNTQTVNGTIITSSQATALSCAPFLPLQAGDKGVRSIEAVFFQTPDIGLVTLVLVKPLAQLQIRGIDAPVEKDYAVDFAQLPEIEPDAYLNFLCLPNGTLAGANIHGLAQFVWG